MLDALFGDPDRLHPVAGFGAAASLLERRCYADDRIAGLGFAVAATAPVLAGAVAGQRLSRSRPLARTVLIAAATWTVLGGASLRRIAAGLAGRLDRADPDGARDLLPSLCGRDPASLDRAGLVRATIESVAENTSDSVVAPLFWGSVAGLPGLLGYRAINTLDAMVGHRSTRYHRFGTACARLDDVANLVPARLTAGLTLLAAPLVQGSARAGWAAWRADAHRHPSPNAGQCEAAAAGVLGIRLGGPTVYQGRVESRPALGRGRQPELADIHRAVRLSRAVQYGALALCAAAALLTRRSVPQ